MASEALKRAALAYAEGEGSGYISGQRRALQAALDPTDEAQVEAVAKGLYYARKERSNRGPRRTPKPVIPWEERDEKWNDGDRRKARAAIAALRDHICGEDTDAP